MLSVNKSYNDPDFYEAVEQDYLTKCDICKKEKLWNEVKDFESVIYNTSIFVCETCWIKIERGEDLDV